MKLEELQEYMACCMGRGADNKNFYAWYTTLKKGLKKSKCFKSIPEVKKWCSRNFNKVTVTSGSWQVLEIFKETELKNQGVKQ